MGAWDYDTFDNDDACDWTAELEGATDLSPVQEALDAALEDDYIEADVGSAALAACEVIARLKGNWGKRDSYTEDVDKWVEANPQTPPQELVDTALKVIDLVRSESSELVEIWEDADASDWLKAVENLRGRVAS